MTNTTLEVISAPAARTAHMHVCIKCLTSNVYVGIPVSFLSIYSLYIYISLVLNSWALLRNLLLLVSG